MRALIVAAASGLIVGSLANSASAAQSRSGDPVVTERISYADLDLGSAAGQNRLKDRISYAAYRLCLIDSSATPSPAIADPVCSRKVMNEGLAQMQRATARASSGPTLAQAQH